MKITGVVEIYALPAEGPNSPATTFIELQGGNTVVLDSSVVSYINLSWDEKSLQHIVEVDEIEQLDKEKL